MKKIFIALMALLVAVACKEKDINLGSRVALSQTEDLEIEAENVPTLNLEVSADGDWIVVTPEWISAIPRYGSGAGIVLLDFEDNYSLTAAGAYEMNADRQATVSVECASGATSFLVKQAGDPMKGNVYVPVTAVKDGGTYLLVAENADGEIVVAKPIASNYGYLYVTTEIMGGADQIAMATDENGFRFIATDDGWMIQQKDGRYVYQTGTFNSFNVAKEIPEGAAPVWDVAFDANGYATITNVGMSKWVQFSQNFNSYGCYPSAQDSGVLPKLYEKVENQ